MKKYDKNEKVRKNDYYEVIMIAYYTGARCSELIALTWDDVDFDNKIIRVNKYFRNHSKILPFRENSSRNRILFIMQEGVELLQNLKKIYTDLNSKSNLVFSDETGNCLNQRKIKKSLKNLLDEQGIYDCNFYMIRQLQYASTNNLGPNSLYKNNWRKEHD